MHRQTHSQIGKRGYDSGELAQKTINNELQFMNDNSLNAYPDEQLIPKIRVKRDAEGAATGIGVTAVILIILLGVILPCAIIIGISVAIYCIVVKGRRGGEPVAEGAVYNAPPQPTQQPGGVTANVQMQV